jgi:hypothetical protein
MAVVHAAWDYSGGPTIRPAPPMFRRRPHSHAPPSVAAVGHAPPLCHRPWVPLPLHGASTGPTPTAHIAAPPLKSAGRRQPRFFTPLSTPPATAPHCLLLGPPLALVYSDRSECPPSPPELKLKPPPAASSGELVPCAYLLQIKPPLTFPSSALYCRTPP